MLCELCSKKEGVLEYNLIDSSKIYICEECGNIIKGIDFIPLFNSRLFHVVMIMDYIDMVKND